MLRTLLVVACAAWSCACATFGGGEPVVVRPLAPPPVYRELFEEVESCSGLRGNFDEIQWFSVSAGQLRVFGTKENGVWVWKAKIFLDEEYLQNGQLVMHEILHFLQQRVSLFGPVEHDVVFDLCHLQYAGE